MDDPRSASLSPLEHRFVCYTISKNGNKKRKTKKKMEREKTKKTRREIDKSMWQTDGTHCDGSGLSSCVMRALISALLVFISRRDDRCNPLFCRTKERRRSYIR
jgi:hypothetical protein